MKFLAHRGYWQSESEKNTIVSFERALKDGFGIETDVREFAGELVISHDIPTKESIPYSDFIDLLRSFESVDISMNIKSDGLQQLLSQQVYPDGTNVYYFDMSVPDSLGYLKSSLPFYTRYSDIECEPCLLAEANGVWLDNFSSNSLDCTAMLNFIKLGKCVTLVSPELHGYEHIFYWDTLKKLLVKNELASTSIAICTDYPNEAREFFYE